MHALAGDSAAQGGQRGLIASDVIGGVARLGESVSNDRARTRGSRTAERKPRRWARACLGTRRHAACPCRVVELRGELGTGKSTFARGVLRALGREQVAIKESELHPARDLRTAGSACAVHLDLYRLNDPDELEHLGLADYHRPGHLWLIEWPEARRGPPPGAGPAIRSFRSADDGHRIERIETSIAKSKLRLRSGA